MASKSEIYRVQPTVDPPSYAHSVPPSYPTAPSNIKSDFPVSCICHNCNQYVTTRIEKRNGLVTWGSCAAIAFFGAPFGGFLGCCLIPFCIDDLKEKIHYCPSCSFVLGRHNIFD